MFNEWFEKGNKAELSRRIRWDDRGELSRLLSGGVAYRDYPRISMPELGYSLSLWNGNCRIAGAEMTLRCGVNSPYVANHVLLKVLASEDGIPLPSFLTAALEGLVGAWDPDNGEIFQLNASEKDFEEVHYGGYSIEPVSNNRARKQDAYGRGTIWFDAHAYERFIS